MDILQELAKLINSQNGSSMAFEMDVTDCGSIVEAVRSSEERLGPISVLVNNSGTSVRKDAIEMTEADYDLIMKTNAKGAFFVAQQVREADDQEWSGWIDN
jgi:3-oxoacyl-[acyl-carrier protein] reductase